jgi:hypothetical protein
MAATGTQATGLLQNLRRFLPFWAWPSRTRRKSNLSLNTGEAETFLTAFFRREAIFSSSDLCSGTEAFLFGFLYYG